MSNPLVSIVILNYFNPEIINVCLRSLEITEGVPYEVVVVDNGSSPEGLRQLREHRDEGRITTLVENKTNQYFSEGNNIGFRNTNPESEYILLLNSDVAVISPVWLTKMLGWMNGTIEHTPCVWNFHPTIPSEGPKDIISFGWSHDANVQPGRVRPEGWCCMFRRSVWRDLSPDLPWHGGFEEAVCHSVRAGAKCGVLWHYQPYLVHREGGSGKAAKPAEYRRQPDYAAMFNGLLIESLDFTIGEHEHDSYLDW